ncbi:uncharacterized protein F4812DRAFT_453930 [Daldinia caldariorum]|uniref:uncharacterized protein n=1 Tax=Daldinia caldariorum TaxID=326644 RepID=UPI00200882C3|nr:uncharacterized protein F4812DRAFT_453930 [Daldinia caldariorum]KAI1462904.1 hypothetical protein F4812DRAFT_453930 [Daldinia caldariorum]
MQRISQLISLLALIKGKGASAPRQPSNRKSRQQSKPPISNGRKHADLKSAPKVALSARRWKNVNRAIEKTVDIVLSRNIALDGFGPSYWEMDEGYAVALKRLRKLARDGAQKEFQFPFRGNGVWFWFKATQLMTGNLKAGTLPDPDIALQKRVDEAGHAAGEDGPSHQKRQILLKNHRMS